MTREPGRKYRCVELLIKTINNAEDKILTHFLCHLVLRWWVDAADAKGIYVDQALASWFGYKTQTLFVLLNRGAIVQRSANLSTPSAS